MDEETESFLGINIKDINLAFLSVLLVNCIIHTLEQRETLFWYFFVSILYGMIIQGSINSNNRVFDRYVYHEPTFWLTIILGSPIIYYFHLLREQTHGFLLASAYLVGEFLAVVLVARINRRLKTNVRH